MLYLDSTEIDDAIDSVAPPSGPWEMVDLFLLELEKRTTEFQEEVEFRFERDFPIVFAKSEREFQAIVEQANRLEFTRGRIREARILATLTLDGWKRIDLLRREQRITDQAFVAMWMDPQMDEAWNEGIHPALEDNGWNPLRADSIEHNDMIDDRIIADIQRSSLLVADLTGHRGGVYFEAGYAKGLDIPVVWTCRKDLNDTDKTGFSHVHFDNRQFNFIIWKTPEELRERLFERVRATAPAPSVPGS